MIVAYALLLAAAAAFICLHCRPWAQAWSDKDLLRIIDEAQHTLAMRRAAERQERGMRRIELPDGTLRIEAVREQRR